MPHAPKPRQRRTVTFLHTADWQLGKPFASITDPAKRARVQQERIEVIRRIGAVARDRAARFVVVVGDLFDSPTPAHATISAALGAIAEIGVPVFAIPGNHDHAGPDSLWEQPFFQRERSRLAPEFHVLTTRQPHRIALADRGDGAHAITLLPCPLLRRREADDPTAWLRDFDFSELDDAPRIVIAHGSTMAFTAGGSQRRDDDETIVGSVNTLALDRLPLEEVDYVAIGDWHGFTAAGPKAWFSGTPEIDRFPKAGQEPGHVACVTATRGAEPTVAAIRTGRFRWLAHEISLDAVLGDAERGIDATLGDDVDTGGPARLDDWLTQATQPQAPGEPGFDGCLAEITLAGTVSLAGRAELDRIVESWRARLLRLDLVDEVRIAPTIDEVHDLAHRPDDPIIARVAAELVRRLESGTAVADGGTAEHDVIRHALFMLHALAHPELAAANSSASAASSSFSSPSFSSAGAKSA